MTAESLVIGFEAITLSDLAEVGGKNASLGEMISNLSAADIEVPPGFATTAHAFRCFLNQDGLAGKIYELLVELDVDDIKQLTSTGQTIREKILAAELPHDLVQEIRSNYDQLQQRMGVTNLAVAVRSSATAEDLPQASFAGQQETFLNITGIDDVLHAVKLVFASLYNDRAIAYRSHQNFSHEEVALSVGVQAMVRSDLAASGVIFTLDTESGYDKVVFITSSYGLGEAVVQGAVNPDEFYVHKENSVKGIPAILRKNIGSKLEKMVYAENPAVREQTIEMQPVPEALQQQFSLSNAEVERLAQMAISIEQHYGRPMDIEWGKDGISGALYILQARPETVKSQQAGNKLSHYELQKAGQLLVEGRAIGQKIGVGQAKVIDSVSDMHTVETGDVLVTDMTDPDWEPVMKRAAAIVTNRGGRTCHAAIIAREMGIPAIVGCMDATNRIRNGESVTVSCAEGEVGKVYRGALEYKVHETNIDKMPEAPCKLMLNVANPDRAFQFANMPHHGVGLARLEFIINTMIGIHPKALLEYDKLPEHCKTEVGKRIAAYDSPVDFYVSKLAEGIATIASSFAPEPVIVRLSDFKSNEYANLLGGDLYEPDEENPMLGFRGASRYISENFAECFALECKAFRYVRETMGFSNLQLMIPFVRTVAEAEAVIEALKMHGLERGKAGLKIIMMCELPTNALLAEQFLEYFDGFSIGSNDMTQLTLGLDRDSALVADCFDERNEAVKILLGKAIEVCRAQGKYIGICGQGPSDHSDLAEWLLEQGISSVSLNPDTLIETWLHLAKLKSH